MLIPLRQFICDVCGEVIETPEIGYVIWRSDRDGEDQSFKDHSFKIIHKSQCDLKDHSSSMSLDTFLGPDGLAYLLSMLSIGPLKVRLGQSGGADVRDMHEFIDFFRRVQTPYYEEARQYFDDEDVLDWNADANEVGPYLPERLERLVKTKEESLADTKGSPR